MIQTFVIQGRMVGTNEYINACRHNRYKGAYMKRFQQDYVLDAMRKSDLVPVEGKVDVHIKWHEQTKRRDHDNITIARKFILDALVEGGILKDDSPEYVGDFKDDFFVDRKNPRIEVTLKEVQSET